jgi:CRISPR-associated endonuclease Cas1 subtype II
VSWRTVVVSSSSKLDYQMGFMVVRTDTTLRIHLDEIYMLLLESTAISLTTALLSELSKRKIKVVFCDEKRNPSAELLPYYGAFDTSSKIKKQMTWTEEQKGTVWTEIVTEKIRKQAAHLAGKKLKEADLLEQYIREIDFADATNREGHAAKVYFNALFGMDFTRTAENAINAGLNYGYSILLSTMNREIVSNGYLTQLGLFHDNMFNPYNLGSDFMEPFRPLVDELIWNLKPEKFEHEEKMEVLKLLQKEIEISGKKEILTNAIKIYCRSIFDALNDNDPALIKFYSYEF